MSKATFTREQIRRWEQRSFDGFKAWLHDTKPCILSDEGKFVVFQLQDFQENALREALAIDESGNFKYQTIIISWPRRHSKTTINALIALWRLMAFSNENEVCIASSERQIQSVGFGLVKKIILNSPIISSMFNKDDVQSYVIKFAPRQSTLRTMSNNIAGLYGERLTVGWCSELHSLTSDEPLQILASSIGDSKNSMILIDSTTDTTGGHLHNLENLSKKQDPSIYVSRIEYKNLEHALSESPHWISRTWLQSREKQLPKEVFASQHLNSRQESTNVLFQKRAVNDAKDKTLPPVINKDLLLQLANGRNYQIGAGLDRAFAYSGHGDSTIYTVCAKVASADPHEEAHFYILKQEKIFASLGKLIKKAIQDSDNEYKLNALAVESYNAQDIFHWSQSKGYPSELIFANATHQEPAFQELYRLFSERRIHFSADLKDLERELLSFTYEIANGKAKYGNRKNKDDRIYSMLWAIYSLRNKEIDSYSVDAIICDSQSVHAPLCFLRSNDENALILQCSERCQTYFEVKQLYNAYSSSNLDSELSIQQFFRNIVSHSGMTVIL